jgi:1,4-dihydroxy-2-naphthoate polyprenyltransferase
MVVRRAQRSLTWINEDFRRRASVAGQLSDRKFATKTESTMPATEPTLAALPNPAFRYFLATRPPFLTVTLIAALIGIATAYANGVALHPATAVVTVLFALVAHAGVNVLNDFYDARNGTDGVNVERIYPFTGGSRFIQNGVLTPTATLAFGIVLIVVTIVAGIGLMLESGSDLFYVGAAGLAIGWAYSAPPLALNSHGFGEACVFVGFALIAIGADFVQRGAYAPAPLVAAVGFALLVTDILYINQFPDRKADALAGKRHWVVRLPVEQARWGYPLIVGAAYLWVAGAVATGALPWLALISLAPAFLSVRAARILHVAAARPADLAPALPMTIAAASLHGILLVAALAVSGYLSR